MITISFPLIETKKDSMILNLVLRKFNTTLRRREAKAKILPLKDSFGDTQIEFSDKERAKEFLRLNLPIFVFNEETTV